MTRPHLAPCSACGRHVRVTEDACPFCGAALAASLRGSAAPVAPSVRLSRAALFAVGALGMGTLAVAPGCSSSSTSTIVPYGIPPVPDGGDETDDAGDAGIADVAAVPHYGLPPLRDASEEPDAGDSGIRVLPPYGIAPPPPPEDGGGDGALH